MFRWAWLLSCPPRPPHPRLCRQGTVTSTTAYLLINPIGRKPDVGGSSTATDFFTAQMAVRHMGGEDTTPHSPNLIQAKDALVDMHSLICRQASVAATFLPTLRLLALSASDFHLIDAERHVIQMMLHRGGAFNGQPHLLVDHSDRYDLSAVCV